ncbi:MAG: MBL fold metallo-hydrolase [Chloroflexota bacterium]|jgi:L-ascorbate metabolism protein UlaG (beta-lactamase superfamily)
MEIIWYGMSCFRITERKLATIVTDPFAPTLGLGEVKLKSDVVTISHDAQGHNYLPVVSGYEHVLRGPGEYEIGGVFITGIATPSRNDAFNNVVYVLNYNGLTIAHLGDIGNVPSQKQIEDLELVNILLVPVGGGSSLSASHAAELVSMIEPNVVIPMHYQLTNLSLKLDPLDKFLKEMGVTEVKEESSFKATGSDTLPEETEVVVLSYKN